MDNPLNCLLCLAFVWLSHIQKSASDFLLEEEQRPPRPPRNLKGLLTTVICKDLVTNHK